jgi:hypothetical protein
LAAAHQVRVHRIKENTMTRIHPAHVLLAVALAAGGGAAQAYNYSKSVLNGARDDIKATYKAERDACGKLAGNAKDICVEEAKGHEKIALAWLDYNYSGSTSDQAKLNEAIYESRYEVAKERCDDLAGEPKDVCQREAKTARDKAKADAKANQKIMEAQDDAAVAKMKADYKLAVERCDTLAGERKDVCVASAKARYHERW